MTGLSIDAIPAPKLRRTELDLSSILGKPEKQAVFVWMEPDTQKHFTAPTLAPKLQKNNPEWTLELCRTVALLALCHIAPEVENDPLEFYTALALRNSQLFGHVSDHFLKAFPELENFGAAVQAAKND